MNVLMILNHAPDYREPFLRELGEKVNLTVVAQPCEPDGLSPPEWRKNYQYKEIQPLELFNLLWQPGLGSILHNTSWDIVCVSANLRHVSRIALFVNNAKYRKKWIWWGLIFGEVKSKFVSRVRNYLLSNAAHCLVHSKSVSLRLREQYKIDATSFNNTEIRSNEFRDGVYNKVKDKLNILFVGTYKPRKKIERLIELADRRSDVMVRIVGPGMEALEAPDYLVDSGRVQIFERATGSQLNTHFDWADVAVSPGNVGLLIMNAARHGKGIIIDNNSYHGPEYWLAKETDQPFISFADESAVDRLIDDVHNDPGLIRQWGQALQEKARQEYTIESMVKTHIKVFESVINKNQSSPQ
ncbi:MAG: glycosyltransferase family 4 protein [Chloroflexota bacterium]|nr:glycosyltransferase family 4 protein [Chloroflexota bacterium]